MKLSRRSLLRYSSGLLAASYLPISACTDRPGDVRHQSLIELTAVDAIARMKAGDLLAEEYAAALLARAESKKDLNAFIALNADQVMEAARAADSRRNRGEPLGALHGLLIPVKDSVFTADYPTTTGTAALSKIEYKVDAPLVARLKAEGAIVMGKTNLHELSSGYTSNNEVFGPVRNPRDPARIPGGSSGGTAAAVASGMAAIGIAEDTAGSIRVPAALCGLVGFRPTTGRYPNDEVVPLTPTFDQLGPIARSVADVILFDSISANSPLQLAEVKLDGVRIGVPREHFYQGLSAETDVVISSALERLQHAGVHLIDAEIPEVGLLMDRAFFPMVFYEAYAHMDAFFRQIGVSGGLPEVLEQAGPRIRASYNEMIVPGAAAAVSEQTYQQALAARQRLREVIEDYFAMNKLDALLYPSTLRTAPLIGEEPMTTIDGVEVPLIDALGHNMPLAPSCELPALTLPAGIAESGLPVGIELAAPPAADRKLLSLGAGLERALGPLAETALS